MEKVDRIVKVLDFHLVEEILDSIVAEETEGLKNFFADFDAEEDRKLGKAVREHRQP